MPTEENIRMKDLVPFATVPPDVVVPVDSPTMGSGHLTPEQIAEYGGHESDRDIFVANYGTPGFDRLVLENNAGRICFVKNSSEGFEEIFQLTEFSESEIAGYSFMKSSEGKVVKKVSVDSDNTWTIGTVEVDDVDDAFSSTSENPVQNKVIYEAIGNVETLLAAL